MRRAVFAFFDYSFPIYNVEAVNQSSLQVWILTKKLVLSFCEVEMHW